MKEFIEKLIGRLEEQIFSAELYNDEIDGQTVDNLICLGDVADTVNQLAEEYKTACMDELVEARRNCSEDSDCSQRIFGQVENRCYLAELQIDADVKYNNGWIPCSERLPEVEADVLLSLRSLDVYTGFRANTEGCFYVEGEGYVEFENVLAWQPLPPVYQPKGE